MIQKNLTFPGESPPNGGDSPNLYTCLREAAPAKAGRDLIVFYYDVSEHVTEATLGDIACYP